MRRVFISVIVVCSLAGRAAADDLYVSNVGGDDRFDGRSASKLPNYSGPTRTLAKALRVAQPGDEIFLENTGQPYRESITLEGPRHSGKPGKPFAIYGNGAVLDGTVAVPGQAWEHVRDDVFRVQPARLHYQQLFLGEKPAVRGPGTKFDMQLASLKPREWLMGVGYLYFRTDPETLPQAYAPAYAGEPVGVTLYQVHDVAIVNLTVRGFQIDGINAHDRVQRLLLAGVNCYANGRSGVAICGASQADVRRCVLSGNGQAQLHVEGPSETHVEECELRADTGPATENRGGRLYLH